MAEFPTYEEMAKNVAEKALDDFLYNGKSIREWMQIIASEDCISRQAVLDYIDKMPSELTTDGRRMIRRRTLEEYISDTFYRYCSYCRSYAELMILQSKRKIWTIMYL